jgi:hypothetical protein
MKNKNQPIYKGSSLRAAQRGPRGQQYTASASLVHISHASLKGWGRAEVGGGGGSA